MERLSTHSIEHDGSLRRYRLWLPNPIGRAVPALIALSGGDQPARTFTSEMRLRPSQDDFLRPGAMIVVPEPEPGDGRFRCWNTGHFVGAHLDDVGFVRACLEDAVSRAGTVGLEVDLTRISALGYSNGGMLAYRLAAEAGALFGAIGVLGATIGGDIVGGRTWLNLPQPDGPPVSIIHLHGLADDAVVVSGGRNRTGHRIDRSAFESIRPWAMHNGCSRVPVVSRARAGPGRRLTFGEGRDGTSVVLELVDGGHDVPTRAPATIVKFLLGAGGRRRTPRSGS